MKGSIEIKYLYEGKYYSSYDEAREALVNYESDRVADVGYRQALPSDIIEGNIVYLKLDDHYEILIIEDVLRPNSAFKAFCADDGCRYGLDGLFIKEDS